MRTLLRPGTWDPRSTSASCVRRCGMKSWSCSSPSIALMPTRLNAWRSQSPSARHRPHTHSNSLTHIATVSPAEQYTHTHTHAHADKPRGQHTLEGISMRSLHAIGIHVHSRLITICRQRVYMLRAASPRARSVCTTRAVGA